MEKYLKERECVAKTMKKLYERCLTTVSGGNISLRLTKDLFCITPSQLDKSELKADLIAIVGMDGTNYTPDLKLSIESEMHRHLLINRPDINAVVHSHPIYASTFSDAKGEQCSINVRLNAEIYLFMPEIAIVSYCPMGSKELVSKVSEKGKTSDVMLLRNHGAIALASTLLKAFDRIDLLERAAKMTIISKQMEKVQIEVEALTGSQCKELDRLF